MRIEILTIITGNGKQYEVKSYSIADQAHPELSHVRLHTKREARKEINRLLKIAGVL
jgi:hypothetical protein